MVQNNKMARESLARAVHTYLCEMMEIEALPVSFGPAPQVPEGSEQTIHWMEMPCVTPEAGEVLFMILGFLEVADGALQYLTLHVARGAGHEPAPERRAMLRIVVPVQHFADPNFGVRFTSAYFATLVKLTLEQNTGHPPLSYLVSQAIENAQASLHKYYEQGCTGDLAQLLPNVRGFTPRITDLVLRRKKETT